jgi:hypothetical protein
MDQMICTSPHLHQNIEIVGNRAGSYTAFTWLLLFVVLLPMHEGNAQNRGSTWRGKRQDDASKGIDEISIW